MSVWPVNMVDVSLNVPFLCNQAINLNTAILARDRQESHATIVVRLLTPRRRPILLMGRLVLGRNLCARLTNGSS